MFAVVGPDAGHVEIVLAEDAEVVGGGDGAGDVVGAAVVPLGDGEFGASPSRSDFGFNLREEVDWPAEYILGYPRDLGERRVPEAARALHNCLDLVVS